MDRLPAKETRAQGTRTGSDTSWTEASVSDLSAALGTSLLLDSAPVGVRIIRSAEEFSSHPFSQPQVPVHYCSAVKMATEGTSLKLDLGDMSCDTAPRTLGLQSGFLDAEFVDSYVTGGLYADLARAEEVLAEVTTLEDVTGVALGPLESFSDLTPPDVVIVPTLPYGAMRIAQATSYGGKRARSNVIGMHGVCSECTAAPVATGEVCTSLLCSGTRYIAGWDEQLISVGIPFDLLPAIVDALLSTVARYETNERKDGIRSSDSCSVPSPGIARRISEIPEEAGYFYEE